MKIYTTNEAIADKLNKFDVDINVGDDSGELTLIVSDNDFKASLLIDMIKDTSFIVTLSIDDDSKLEDKADIALVLDNNNLDEAVDVLDKVLTECQLISCDASDLKSMLANKKHAMFKRVKYKDYDLDMSQYSDLVLYIESNQTLMLKDVEKVIEEIRSTNKDINILFLSEANEEIDDINLYIICA